MNGAPKRDVHFVPSLFFIPHIVQRPPVAPKKSYYKNGVLTDISEYDIMYSTTNLKLNLSTAYLLPLLGGQPQLTESAQFGIVYLFSLSVTVICFVVL